MTGPGRKVRWRAPARDRYDNAVRESKCGRFKVTTRAMASGRNGYWNDRAYLAERADGTRIGRLHDTLTEALDAVEFENDPNWETA